MADNNCIRTAQAVGLLGSAFAAGSITSLSTISIQTMLLPPRKPTTLPGDTQPGPGVSITHLSHQWLNLYDRGKKMFPVIAASSSAAYGYLSWALWDKEHHKACSYMIAGLVTVSIVPYTVVLMQTINNKLNAHATRDDAAMAEGREAMKMSEQELARREREDMEVPGLLRKWSCLNMIRGTMPLVGALVGAYATVFV